MKFKWQINDYEDLGWFDQLLKNRNLNREFFNEDFDLPSPSLLKDIDKATNRIIQALYENQKIVIFGHDDLDGITSTYILFDFLTSIGYQKHYSFIPNRMLYNHGIQENFVDFAKKNSVDLVITVDGGIKSYESIDKLNQMGIDTIITDHHIVPEELPAAFAIINPKRNDSIFPYDMLAGVGVTYFLILYLANHLNVKSNPSYLLWTAIGSLADKVPMSGLNRKITRYALLNWHKLEDNNLKYLSNNQRLVTITDKISFAFFIIKLLSNGRDVEGKHDALSLLQANIFEKKSILSKLLDQKRNYENQQENVNKIAKKLLAKANTYYFIFYDKDREIPLDMLGYVASIITKIEKIPSLILHKKEDGEIACEARSTDGINLVKLFDESAEMLNQYGGHARAAGFTMSPEYVEDFENFCANYFEQHKSEILEERKLQIDIVFNSEDFYNFDLKNLDVFQPFGESNLDPNILVKNFKLEKFRNSARFNICGTEPLDTESAYDLVLSYKGIFFQLIDYSKIT